MESGNTKYADLNFYGLPTRGSSMFTMDLYSNPISDVSLVGNQLSLLSRKVKNCKLQYTLIHPALPMMEPSCTINVCIEDLVNIKKISKDGIAKWKLKPKADKQVRFFLDNYPKFAHESLRNFDKSCRNKNKEHIFPLIVGYSNVNRSSKLSKTFSDIAPEIYDIPEPLLLELLENSLFQEYDTFKDNFGLKNCIASWCCFKILYLFFPKGLDFSLLSVNSFNFKSNENKFEKVLNFKYGSLNNLLNIEMNFEIKEVFVESNFLYIRGNYQFVQFGLESLFEENKLIEIRRFSFDTLAQSVAVNPYVPGEFFVTTPGSVFLVLEDGNTQKSREFPEDIDNSWYNCIYGSFRQTCIVSCQDEVRMHDFRISSPSSKQYFSVPCQYLNRTEKFSQVLLWNPINRYQFFITTDQSVILLDERYVKTPVLKLNHYMNSPPRFGQALSRSIYSHSDSVLLNVSAYLSAENINMQFCNNGRQNVLIGDSSLEVNCPLSLLSEPWKFSSYNEWMPYTSHWKLSNELVIAKMKQPLIGSCICVMEENNKNDNFIYVQLTLAGDLFYQNFSCSTSNSVNEEVEIDLINNKYLYSLVDNNVMQLNDNCNEICQNWLDKCLTKDTNLCKARVCVPEQETINTNDVQELNIKSEIVVPIKSEIAEPIKSEIFVPIKSEIVEPVNNILPVDDDLKIFSYIKSMRNENKILTNCSLKRQSSHNPNTFIKNPEMFNYPLSCTLYNNWINDNYTPLDVYAPNLALDSSLNFF